MTFQTKKYSSQIEKRKKIRNKILFNSDKIVVASNFLKDLALKIGLDKGKIKVIYNSVDFLDFSDIEEKEKLRQRLGLKGKVLLTISRLTPWKGTDTLIQIMPDLVQKYNQIKLIIIGVGQEQENLEKLTQSLNLEKQVVFLGKLEHKKTMEYLKAADAFVLNTFYEGMSHTILEAMKIGTPVITTHEGGNPETIQDGKTGLLVEYNNKEKWLKAMHILLDNQGLRNDLVQEAQNDLKRFNWNNLVNQTINIFKEL